MTTFPNTLNSVQCPVCRQAAAYDFVKYQKSFYSCGSCGLGFIYPPPVQEEVDKIYDKEYYASWGIDGDDTATALMKQATFRDKLNVIEQQMPAKGRMLDIGCATGFFLDVAKERGWSPYGVELSAYSAAIARGRIGEDRIFTGQLSDAGFADQFFDAVVMTDVIEHVTDVHSFIAEVARILRPGGVAAITTPNPLTASRLLLRKNWPHYKVEHLTYFTPKALSLLMTPAGFKRQYLAAATKSLTFAYLALQLKTYPVPIVTPFVSLIGHVLPDRLQKVRFRIYSGELFAIDRREEATNQ